MNDMIFVSLCKSKVGRLGETRQNSSNNVNDDRHFIQQSTLIDTYVEEGTEFRTMTSCLLKAPNNFQLTFREMQALSYPKGPLTMFLVSN